MGKENKINEPVNESPHSIPEIRRFLETMSLSIVFLTFAIACVSIINYQELRTFSSILYMILAIVSVILFLLFSIGLIYSRITDLYDKTFEYPMSWKSSIFLSLYWIAIVIGFIIALFSSSFKFPEFLILPAKIITIIWAIYIVIGLFFRQLHSNKHNSK